MGVKRGLGVDRDKGVTSRVTAMDGREAVGHGSLGALALAVGGATSFDV